MFIVADLAALNCLNKIIKIFLARFTRSFFFQNKTLINYLGRPLNFTVFILASVKVILLWSFYCYNFYHADFDRKLIE